jgi:hypothetical protein
VDSLLPTLIRCPVWGVLAGDYLVALGDRAIGQVVRRASIVTVEDVLFMVLITDVEMHHFRLLVGEKRCDSPPAVLRRPEHVSANKAAEGA